jgi:hypothetical protein
MIRPSRHTSTRLFLDLRVCGMVPGSDTAYAIMVRRGNGRLRDALNAVLTDIESDGTLMTVKQLWLSDPPTGHITPPGEKMKPPLLHRREAMSFVLLMTLILAAVASTAGKRRNRSD